MALPCPGVSSPDSRGSLWRSVGQRGRVSSTQLHPRLLCDLRKRQLSLGLRYKHHQMENLEPILRVVCELQVHKWRAGDAGRRLPRSDIGLRLEGTVGGGLADRRKALVWEGPVLSPDAGFLPLV